MTTCHEVSFWVCLVGAMVDLMLFFVTREVFPGTQLSVLFAGSALAFAVGAFCFWLNDN